VIIMPQTLPQTTEADTCPFGHDFRYEHARGGWYCTECNEEK
jgi:hypothetical protein